MRLTRLFTRTLREAPAEAETAAHQLMLRAGLIDMRASQTGIRYEAGDEAHSFVSALSSNYIAELRRRSHWVVEQFGALTDEQVRQRMGTLFGGWSEELGRDGKGERPWTG